MQAKMKKSKNGQTWTLTLEEMTEGKMLTLVRALNELVKNESHPVAYDLVCALRRAFDQNF